MPSYSIGALFGLGLALLCGGVYGGVRDAPSRRSRPASWARFWMRGGLGAGVAGLLGTILLISGYWWVWGTPESVREPGAELAMQTLGYLVDPIVWGLVGGVGLCLWAPARLYDRMTPGAMYVHLGGTLLIWAALVANFTGFVATPPLSHNAQAGIALFLYTMLGGLLYVLVLGATVGTHLYER